MNRKLGATLVIFSIFFGGGVAFATSYLFVEEKFVIAEYMLLSESAIVEVSSVESNTAELATTESSNHSLLSAEDPTTAELIITTSEEKVIKDEERLSTETTTTETTSLAPEQLETPS